MDIETHKCIMNLLFISVIIILYKTYKVGTLSIEVQQTNCYGLFCQFMPTTHIS